MNDLRKCMLPFLSVRRDMDFNKVLDFPGRPMSGPLDSMGTQEGKRERHCARGSARNLLRFPGAKKKHNARCFLCLTCTCSFTLPCYFFLTSPLPLPHPSESFATLQTSENNRATSYCVLIFTLCLFAKSCSGPKTRIPICDHVGTCFQQAGQSVQMGLDS